MLFRTNMDNILPYDGRVSLNHPILEGHLVNSFNQKLLETINWQHDAYVKRGEVCFLKRKMAWFGDKPFIYKYSQLERVAEPWNIHVGQIKCIVEKELGYTFNSCLANFYPDGTTGMGWHADDEAELCSSSPIASISFGAMRIMKFRHKTTREQLSVPLENGSLLVMFSPTQQFWLHQIPKSLKIQYPRINLTFRTIRTGVEPIL